MNKAAGVAVIECGSCPCAFHWASVTTVASFGVTFVMTL